MCGGEPLGDQEELPGKSRAGERFPKHTVGCDGVVITVFYSEMLCMKLNLLTKYNNTISLKTGYKPSLYQKVSK